jgi:hypothetical protein
MMFVPTEPIRALLAQCLGSRRLKLDAGGPHTLVSDEADGSSLPGDILELIVQHLPRSDHAAARLTCRDIKELIAPLLRTVFIKDWDEFLITVSCNWGDLAWSRAATTTCSTAHVTASSAACEQATAFQRAHC